MSNLDVPGIGEIKRLGAKFLTKGLPDFGMFARVLCRKRRRVAKSLMCSAVFILVDR